MVGGGHSHALALLALARRPLRDVAITLLGIEAYAPYSGMLPGVVAGHYREHDAQIDLAALASRVGATFRQARVVSLDLPGRKVRVEDGTTVAFDWLSLDVGSTPDLETPGAREHTVPVKPVSSFQRRWEQMLARLRARAVATSADVAVVGAGAGGVELALAVAYRVASEGLSARVRLHLLTGASGLLPTYGGRVRAVVRNALGEAGIRLHAGGGVERVSTGQLHCVDGSVVRADEILWVTRASAQPWLADSGLATDARGFVRIDATLRSVSHPYVFASGDCASLDGARLPKAGVFAVRQAPVLTRNFRAVSAGLDLTRYVPQTRYLSLLTTGSRHALAWRHSWWAPHGAWVWHWKDWLDRQFIRRFRRAGTGTER